MAVMALAFMLIRDTYQRQQRNQNEPWVVHQCQHNTRGERACLWSDAEGSSACDDDILLLIESLVYKQIHDSAPGWGEGVSTHLS